MTFRSRRGLRTYRITYRYRHLSDGLIHTARVRAYTAEGAASSLVDVEILSVALCAPHP